MHTHGPHTCAHAFTLACARTLCRALGDGKGGAGAPPGVRRAGIPRAPRPVPALGPLAERFLGERQHPAGRCSAAPPVAGHRRRGQRLPPRPSPHSAPTRPLRHPPQAGGIAEGRGGAGRAHLQGAPPGVWVRGHRAPWWSCPRSGSSPHPASSMPSQLSRELRGGGALAPVARSSPPVLLLMQAALGKAPPGHRAHLGCWGHLGSLPTGRSQPQAGQGALGRSTAFSAGFLPLALGLLPAGQGSGCL